MADAPNTLLDSVWEAAMMAWHTDDFDNPWPEDDERHTVWALSQKAAAELFAWEQSPEALALDADEERRYREAREIEAKASGSVDPDHSWG
jgi:hypothetical protein